MSQTAASVDITAYDNVTLQDAFQFGDPTDTTWDFTGMNFRMEIKADRDDVSPLLALTSTGGTIVVDSITQRVLHLQVSEAALQAAIPVGEYVYDLVMYDGAVPPVRTMLMQGAFSLKRGVTET